MKIKLLLEDVNNVYEFFNQDEPQPGVSWDEWWEKFHKTWFWGEFGERVVVWKDGSISILSANTSYHPEDEKDVLFYYPCPGWNNIDTWELYEQGYGILKDGKWEWDPEFIKLHPEYKENFPEPTWADIVNAAIETGDWTDFYETIEDEVIREYEYNKNIQ